MNPLTERQKFILTLVIHEHIRSAQPLGSQFLVDRFRLEMSPATVRNELAALTEKGFLRQPHTSAGRVPTEEGYRLFVGSLIQETDLPEDTRHTISHQFYQMRFDVEQWMRLAASVLAHHARAASLVTALQTEQPKLKHMELISTCGRQALMVIVLVGGEVRQRILTLSEPFTQEQLSESTQLLSRLMREFGNPLPIDVITQLQPFECEIAELVDAEMGHARSPASVDIYLDGISNVLSEPEFSGSEEGRRAVHLLEERTTLQSLFARTTPSGTGSVQVIIGGEGLYEELRQFSMVLARYGSPGLATGMLGVLGPVRMSYGRTISTVRFIANILSDMVNETLVE